MKKMVCEICGSQSIKKDNGIFVCQECGTEYSLEEAKKLLVDIEESVEKPEEEDRELIQYYEIARRALRENNGENTAKYYALIVPKRPHDWEANFFQVFGTANGCKIRDIRFAQSNVAAAFKSAVDLIKSYVETDKEQESACAQIAQSAINLATAHFNSAFNWFKGISILVRGKFQQEMINYTYACVITLYTVGECLENSFKENQNIMKYAKLGYAKGAELHQILLPYLADKPRHQNTINLIKNKAR